MLRLVMDTDVMGAAFDSPRGASRRLLLHVLENRARMLISTPLLLEYEAVLLRPRVLDMIGLQVAEVLAVLDELALLSIPVAFDYSWRPAARDPDDDLVLETAINGRADVVASFNTSDMVVGAGKFGITVERPGLVLRRIMG